MEKPKRSFEFRMSKKVAELTQVVHMLFTRNHEKEVEMEALKDAYEYEIELVINDAKQKISALKTELVTVRKNNTISHDEKYQKAIKAMRDDYDKKIKDTETVLQDEKTECQNLRDLLISAQGDIEKLRQGVSDQLTYKTDELHKREMELDKVRKQNAILEKRLKDVERDISLTIRECDKQTLTLQGELHHLQGALDGSHKSRESLLSRNKQLESDLKYAKKDFTRKVTEAVSSHITRVSKPTMQSENEELERLKREIQKYKLELKNRDANFNRMFTEKQRIFVDPRAVKVSQNHRAPSPANCSVPVTTSSSINFQRERSFSQVITLPPEEKRLLSTRPASAATGHLPSLALTQAFAEKNRYTKLIKPKPLPKELMFSK